VTSNPTVGIATPKKERGSRTALRSDEYTKLLSLAGANPRDYAILQMFLQTGIRVSELCTLTREDAVRRLSAEVGQRGNRLGCMLGIDQLALGVGASAEAVVQSTAHRR
jgi:site-specific recombinase XerC